MANSVLIYGANEYLVISYYVNKVLYSAKSYARIKVKKSDADNIPIGAKVDFVYDKGGANERKLFEGIVISKRTIANLVELQVNDLATVLYYKFVRKRIKPSDVGKTGSIDLADVVRYLVDQVSNVSYTSTSIQDTGNTQLYFDVNDYAGKVIDRIANSVGYVWYIEDGILYFKEPDELDSSVVIDNSVARFEKWEYDVNKLCNEIHLFGANRSQHYVDRLAGDGSTKVFALSYMPTGNVKVIAYYPPYNGIMDPSKYLVHYSDGTIEFLDAPPAVESVSISGYEKWTYKQKIDLKFDADVTNPIVYLQVTNSDSPLSLMRGDYKDVRFVDTDGNAIPFVYLGKDRYGTLKFAIKIEGTFTANQVFTMYMLFGNPSAESWPYQYSDVLNVYDVFDEKRDLEDTKWDYIPKSYDGTSCDPSDWSESSNIYFNTSGADVYAGYLILTVDIDPSAIIPDGYNTIAARMIATTKSGFTSPVVWIYWDNDPQNPKLYNGTELTLYATAIKSDVCDDVLEDRHYYYNGVYWVEAFTYPTITFYSYEPIGNYNIEVFYDYSAPIYVLRRDDSSISDYGVVFSKTHVARWINDESTAISLAEKYLNKYSSIIPSTKAKMPINRFLSMGLWVGLLVSVNDKIGNVVTGTNAPKLLINRVEFENGVATIHLGESRYDITKWADDVDTRIRQIEIRGDENFFII